jgi:hypothetical protein
MVRARIDDRSPALERQRARRQRHGDELVRAQGRVVAVGPVQHVEAPAVTRVPETVEAGGHARGELVEHAGRAAQAPRETPQGHECGVPEPLISIGVPMRGVTTQSSIFTSIHVTCAPGSPAASNPSAGSTRMP